MLKEFLLKKMLKAKMGNVPEAQQDKMIKLVSENPELFKKIGAEIQAKMKEGKSQTSAAMEVMRTHQEELKKLA